MNKQNKNGLFLLLIFLGIPLSYLLELFAYWLWNTVIPYLMEMINF